MMEQPRRRETEEMHAEQLPARNRGYSIVAAPRDELSEVGVRSHMPAPGVPPLKLV